MLIQRIFFAAILIATLSPGCKKDLSNRQCQQLKDEMIADNVPEVITLLTQKVNQLSSKIYTEENLNKLAASLSGECSISAQALCFSCIQTLPEQSEIRLSFTSSGQRIIKLIDISYTSDNKMKVLNMHN